MEQMFPSIDTAVPIPVTDGDRRPGDVPARHRDAILRAVATAATRFLGASDGWEHSIDDVLRLLGEATEASRVYLFRTFRDERGVVRADLTHEWTPADSPSSLGERELHDLSLDEVGLGRLDALSRGEILHGPLSLMPEEEARFVGRRGVR